MESKKKFIELDEGDVNEDLDINYQEKLIIIQPKSKKHQQTLIFLHGINQEASEFLPLFTNKTCQIFPSTNTKIILVQAQEILLQGFNNKKMYAWYEIKDRYKRFEQNQDYKLFYDIQQLKQQQSQIESLISKEIQLLDNQSEKVYLGGFSQGCTFALHIAFEYAQALGGVIGFSGYLLQFTDIKQNLKVFLAHGKKDQILKLEDVEPTYQRLKNQGPCILIIDNMDHEIRREAILGAQGFIQDIIRGK